MNAASNSDIMSCSSIASESNDILALDEEVTILEVTKKETLPLAVIDLLSDEEESAVVTIADEEITVLKEFSLPSTSNIYFSKKINSEKLRECKEEVFRTNVKTDNYNPILTVNFPDLFKKNIVCVPRPPLQLLPNHVKPVKQAYVLELTPKPRFGQPSGSQEKLWNSYRDLEEYNQKRRFRNQGQNRSAPFSSSPYWNDRNSKTFIKSRKHHQNFFSNRGDSFDQSPHNRSHRHYQNFSSNQGNSFNQSANPHSRSHRHQQNFTDSQADSLAENEDSHNRSHRYHQNFSANQVDTFDSSAKFHNNYQTRDFNGNFGQPVNSFQNHSNFALPNSSINSVITINQHDMNVSMGHNQITHPNILNNALIPGFPAIQMPGLNQMAAGNNLNPHAGNNPHFIREIQRTAYTMATNMVSSMIGGGMLNSPPHLPNPHFMANHSIARHPFPANTNEFDAPLNILSGNLNSNLSANISGFNQNFGDQQIRPRMRNGVAFPCSYRNVQNKKSWSDVKSAIGESGSDSDIEEIIPDNPRDILWNKRGISPLVKPGVRYPVGTVQKFLQITQKAKVINKYGYSAKLLPSTSSLEISFDVSTWLSIQKDLSTDPIPKYSDIAILQRKWNDGAFLQLAVVDNGDISFYSFNSLLLPVLIPHQN
ncbi:tRNA-splicing endonuclease subunit Sen54 [Caerostris extrusa]|uniref:tRNA-splicing endonuclease subunit Sen54 n=1 Tax=Caerostris extrusa TaxID=172846 RepID=A0AAV4SMK0_CAEEX|nr:tRNA-splicing endonuclease subunit Sen54 [Caerostris extrusa]